MFSIKTNKINIYFKSFYYNIIILYVTHTEITLGKTGQKIQFRRLGHTLENI